MLQAQDIYNSFSRYKRDISDVSNALFLEWVQFAVRFIYDKTKRVDADRYAKTNTYSVVIPPQTEAIPSDFLDMNQTACGIYKYDTRKRALVTFDDGGDSNVTFSDLGGTSAYNTATKVQGANSRGFTGDAEATLQLAFTTALNLTDFDDGGAASPTNDFISLWVYIGNTLPTSVTIEFSTLSDGSDVDTNELSYAYSSLVAGWNRIKVAKSAFTLTGSAVWTSLGYLRLIYTGGDATTDVYFDKLDLVESEVNGKSETDSKLAITGYGSKKEGYYLKGSDVVFTNANQLTDNNYVMWYLPTPPTIDDLTDYITVDATSDTAAIVEDRHLECLVKAVDVLYLQWDNDPSSESIADFRFIRALGGLLDGFNRTPQISQMDNFSNDF